MVFVKNYFEEIMNMYLHRSLGDRELIDLLALHTNRLSQIKLYGERYYGEYDTCMRTIEVIQTEINSRQDYTLKPAFNKRA
jgi:hypothetical protein